MSDITASSIRIHVNINDDGGTEVIENGMCWGFSREPNINDYSISNSLYHFTSTDGTERYSYSLVDLQHKTIYFIRAYVVNETGTYYSNESGFITF